MSTPTITLYPNALRAASHAMAKDDIRYYLNGALIEATPTETIVVSTNGHFLIVTRSVNENQLVKPVQFIMPRSIVEQICKQIRRADTNPVVITAAADDQWTVALREWSVTFTPVGGNFPAWRRVVPSTTTGEAAQFNPTYMAKVAKAVIDIGGYKRFPPVVRHNGSKGTLILPGNPTDHDFIAVVMPVQSEEAGPAVTPAWATDPEETPHGEQVPQ